MNPYIIVEGSTKRLSIFKKKVKNFAENGYVLSDLPIIKGDRAYQPMRLLDEEDEDIQTEEYF